MILSTARSMRQDRGRTALAVLTGIARVLVIGGLAVYTGLLLIAVAPVALGLRSTVVLTGSMRPAIEPGDVVLSSRVPVSMLRPGQVLLFDNPAHQGVYLMHRYERPGPGGSIITRGDANRVEDSTPVPSRNVRGVPRLRVPWIGMPIVWLRLGTPPRVMYAGAALAGLLVLAFQPRRRTGPKGSGPRGRPRSAAGSRVRRLPRTASAVALVVSFALATHLSTPGANASFTGEVGNPSTFQAVSSFYGSVVLDDAPAGYWRGSGYTDAVSGATATVTGTVYPVAGATPDGDPAVYLPSPGTIRVPKTMQGDLTVEFWFASATGSGGIGPFYSGAPLIHSSIESGSGNVGVSLTADGHLLAGTGSSTMGTEVTAVSAVGGYADGGWHHVAFARAQASGLMRLYVDGALSGSATGGTQLLDSRPYFYVGVSRDLNRYGGDRFDDISTYAAPLTAGQIGAHYAARAVGYAAAVTGDAPAGFWQLDETSGATINATVGAAGSYLGVVAFGVAPAVGAGTAVRLDRIGGYASVPRLISDDFSLEFWFKSTGGANYGQWWSAAGLVDADVPNVVNDFGVGLSESGRVIAGVGNPDTSIESAPGFNNGGWHHVVFTRTMATGGIILYVDGVQAAANPGTGNTGPLDAPTSLTIGRGSPTTPDNSAASNATIDELAQYTHVLTAAQVLAHFQRATS